MSNWLDVYYGSSQMVMTYWTVYVAVIAAIIGYVWYSVGDHGIFVSVCSSLWRSCSFLWQMRPQCIFHK